MTKPIVARRTMIARVWCDIHASVGENVPMPASASRVLIALALAGVVAAGVTACAPETGATPQNTTTPTTAPSEAPAPTASATPAPGTTPVTIDCDTLITPQAMYDYNPNFGLSESYKPEAGTDAADIAAVNGLVCGWINQTSGEVVEVAVANLSDEKLTELKNGFVTSSNSVPTYGDPTKIEGYFEVAEGTGQAQAFAGPYWISSSSASFYEPGDAQPVVAAAIAGLGQ